MNVWKIPLDCIQFSSNKWVVQNYNICPCQKWLKADGNWSICQQNFWQLAVLQNSVPNILFCGFSRNGARPKALVTVCWVVAQTATVGFLRQVLACFPFHLIVTHSFQDQNDISTFTQWGCEIPKFTVGISWLVSANLVPKSTRNEFERHHNCIAFYCTIRVSRTILCARMGWELETCITGHCLTKKEKVPRHVGLHWICTYGEQQLVVDTMNEC